MVGVHAQGVVGDADAVGPGPQQQPLQLAVAEQRLRTEVPDGTRHRSYVCILDVRVYMCECVLISLVFLQDSERPKVDEETRRQGIENISRKVPVWGHNARSTLKWFKEVQQQQNL